MGEVYRARDTRLNRDVALKVLPAPFASDQDRLARFEQEARTLASFSHLNIGAIYGIEESPAETGGTVRALVLELVEGPTLADRIARSALPMADALAIARQIADALEAAHDHGIVHRDLKPANIKVRRDGVVKVLDFGLAKALDRTPAADISGSPTMIASMPGALLGTAAYMAPEQARGDDIDRRVDVWAFGCVLFEMLTGARAFEGRTTSEVLANVLKDEPDWSRLPPDTPPSVGRLLQRCLHKDLGQRWRDIGDARLAIDDAGRDPVVARHATVVAGRTKERLAWGAAIGLVATAVIVAGRSTIRPAPATLVQFEIVTPPAQDPADLPSFEVSPDGRTLVFVAASSDGQPQLWVRPVDSVVSRPIAGTEGALLPFWSADSRSVAFVADGVLRRADLDGGLVRTLVEGVAGAGGTWNVDNLILFPRVPANQLFRMSADGGTVTDATRLESNQAGHLYPHFLPDGRHFLYFVEGTRDVRGVYVEQLDAATLKRLFDADSPAVYASGHVLFARQASLFAQKFDAARLELAGQPFLVAEGVFDAFTTRRYPVLSASADGTVAFRTGTFRADNQFVWFDRTGRTVGTVGDPDSAGALSPAMSPDRKRIALVRREGGNGDVWLLDLQRAVLSRFTNHVADDMFPVWSPDGSRIVFASNRTVRARRLCM